MLGPGVAATGRNEHENILVDGGSMESQVTKARKFALEAHGSQMYGSRPYSDHLDAVAELAAEYGEEAQVVAYLHDVVEDTEVGLDRIAEAFGTKIAECVAILTDAPGGDRKERKRKTYARMAEVTGDLQLALVVKAADRLANLRACIADGREDLLRVYKEEHDDFRKAAWREDLCPPLWGEMETIRASVQHAGANFRFYEIPGRFSLVRIRGYENPDYVLEGKWFAAPPSVLDAIHGMGDDVWSGPDDFADPLTLEQARARADEEGVDLFAERSADPSPEPRLGGMVVRIVVGLAVAAVGWFALR